MGMPNTPAHDAVCRSRMDFYFDRNSRLHTTLGYRVRQIFTSMDMPFPSVMQSLSYDVCPYTLQLEPMCPSDKPTNFSTQNIELPSVPLLWFKRKSVKS